jgi:hypothetical protein
MLITSQTIFPLNAYGKLRIRALNGKFRAATVQRNVYEADPSSVMFMLRNGNEIVDYSMDADMSEDRIIVVEPVGRMATIDVASMNNSIVRPLVYSTAAGYAMGDIKDKFKSWWANPTYKYTIIAASVVLVLLIIWLIYVMIKKRSMKKQNTVLF